MQVQILFVLSGILGLCLNIVALPEFLEIFRPEWLVLVMCYFLIYHDKKMSFTHIFLLGILTDVVTGSTLGQHASIYLVCALIINHYHASMVRANVINSVLWVGAVSFVAIVLNTSIEVLFKEANFQLLSLFSVLMSMAIWPCIYGLTQSHGTASGRMFRF